MHCFVDCVFRAQHFEAPPNTPARARILNQREERDARQLDSPVHRRLPEPVRDIPIPRFPIPSGGAQEHGDARDDPFYSLPINEQSFLRPNELFLMRARINDAAPPPPQRHGRRRRVEQEIQLPINDVMTPDEIRARLIAIGAPQRCPPNPEQMRANIDHLIAPQNQVQQGSDVAQGQNSDVEIPHADHVEELLDDANHDEGGHHEDANHGNNIEENECEPAFVDNNDVDGQYENIFPGEDIIELNVERDPQLAQ